ncbi:MAG: hypothetical protein ACI9TH_004909 [Kiritimatiellia bacterium]|jgi:hypothetical protein
MQKKPSRSSATVNAINRMVPGTMWWQRWMRMNGSAFASSKSNSCGFVFVEKGTPTRRADVSMRPGQVSPTRRSTPRPEALECGKRRRVLRVEVGVTEPQRVFGNSLPIFCRNLLQGAIRPRNKVIGLFRALPRSGAGRSGPTCSAVRHGTCSRHLQSIRYETRARPGDVPSR